MNKAWLSVVGLLLIAFGAVCLAMNAAHRNRVLTTDSIIYVDTARHIAADQGATTNILSFEDTVAPAPQTQWPPFYPTMMAPFIRFGMDPIMAGRLVSALSFGLTVLLVGLWAWRMVGAAAGPIAGLTAAGLLTALPGVTSISAAVWADAFYTLLVTIIAWLGYECVQRERGRLAWFILGSLVGVAILTKYLGLLLFGVVVVIAIFAWRNHHNFRASLYRLSIAIVGALLFLGPLLLRNIVDDKPIGGAERAISSQPIPSILHDLWSTLSHDFTVNKLWIAVLVLTGLAIIVLVQRRSGSATRQSFFLTAIILTYWFGLVAARAAVDTDNVYTRFTMPVYPLAVIMFIILIAQGAKRLNHKIATIPLVGILLLSLTWSVKDYDFKAGPYIPKPSARTNEIANLTTNRDLIIGDGSREYTLYLGRSVIHVSGEPGSQILTPELIAAMKHRWVGKFDRVLVALQRNLTVESYGEYAAALSQGTINSWQPLSQSPALIIYDATNR